MEPDLDAELMGRVAAGDRRAFTQLFERYQANVVRFAFRFVNDKARAEELAQDVFVKLYRSASSYRPDARFKTYLFRVATNHCLNEVRRGEYRMPRAKTEPEGEEDGMQVAGSESPEQALAGKELERAVAQALGELGERERVAFTLCRFEGMAYRDIAQTLRTSESAVKSLIHRATLAVARKVEALQTPEGPARSGA